MEKKNTYLWQDEVAINKYTRCSFLCLIKLWTVFQKKIMNTVYPTCLLHNSWFFYRNMDSWKAVGHMWDNNALKVDREVRTNSGHPKQ